MFRKREYSCWPLRREPSAMFAGTEVTARRSWEVKAKRSSAGKPALMR